jgi:hypothetical protein
LDYDRDNDNLDKDNENVIDKQELKITNPEKNKMK